MRTFPIFALAGLLLVTAARGDDAAADKAWQLGQKAIEADRFDEAIGQFQLGLRLSPNHAPSQLGLAAAYLALGQDRAALPHLRRYVRTKPGHFLIRWPLAELLLRLDEPLEARQQLGLFLSGAQMHPHVGPEQLIGCHTKLMEVAEQIGDRYEEHLNRGIGLLLLARRRAELGGAAARAGCEALLCKSAAELMLARIHRPDEARPAWYLHGVWSSLAQQGAAKRWLRTAREQATPGKLTAGEMRDLCLAWAEAGREVGRK